MQTIRILQAVVLMLIVALAASCAATKEYASKIFPTNTAEKDSQAMALRFLELDKLEPDQENWVTTDIIMGRDTGNATAALDKLSQTFPATGVTIPAKDTPVEINQTTPVYVNAAPVPADKVVVPRPGRKRTDVIKNTSAPVTKTSTVKDDLPAGQTGKTSPVEISEKKAVPVTDQPVAKYNNNGETREKKTREDKP